MTATDATLAVIVAGMAAVTLYAWRLETRQPSRGGPFALAAATIAVGAAAAILIGLVAT